MGIIDLFREIEVLDTSDYSNAHSNLKRIVLDNIFSHFDIDNNKYKIAPSLGKGSFTDMWWIGIFNRKFYSDIYKIKNKNEIGASKGYYIVYLFNKDKNCVFLALGQASAGVSSSIEKTNAMIEKNRFYQEKLFSNSGYLTEINNQLSSEENKKARDYEYSVILAKKYDLKSEINDEEFKSDLKIFELFYAKLIKYISENEFIATENYSIDIRTGLFRRIRRKDPEIKEYIENEVDQFEIQASEHYTNENDIEKSNNRPPKVKNRKQQSYQRDAKLSKTVLVKSNYKCEINKEHITFTTNTNHQYAEAHHLIPMKYQKDYKKVNLDRDDNIVSLCPICHNALHYGSQKEILERLKLLFELKYSKSKIKDLIEINDYFDLYDKFY